MGKTITPKYQLIIDGKTPMVWHGQATQKRLEDFVFGYADSLKIGGANEHISKMLGFIPFPSRAAIYTNNKEHEKVCEWKQAAFQVF
jgi:hypothetical protein